MLLESCEQKRRLMERVCNDEAIFPQTVLIDNISYCNLRCSMCPHTSMNRKKGIMAEGLFRKIIDEIAIKKPDSRIWMTFFGEGLMLPELPQRIEYAKVKGLQDILLNSNGTLLTRKLAVELIKAGLDVLYVGIDAFQKDTYAQIRVGGNLEKVIKGVLEYRETLETHGTPNQKLVVQFVEMDENRAELAEFIHFWNEKSITVKVRPKVSWAGKVKAANLQDVGERLPCFWAMNTVNIMDTGLVCLCSVDLDGQVQVGDINTQTIEEVWNGELKKFRYFHKSSQWGDLPAMCKQCKDWQSGYADYR